ncbi:unnamed protein product [Spirodela intermedia]|uniref:Uncharacterized protein n=1 Tax=Spirodela intermedia TaxID=51605 RepID=A0A7I8L7V2_SPIIN|nr:unnamed protein product [Spirodela intermedia]
MGSEGDAPPAKFDWRETVEERWRKTREHAETYPYVWGSYILVYGGLGVYIAWRWRKLRQTEDRVRVLQEQLRKLVEAEASAANASGSSSTASKPFAAASSSFPPAARSPPTPDKPISR